MNTLFVDTAGWACLCDRREQYHAITTHTYRDARNQGRQLVTTNLVLIELVAVLTSPRRLPRPEIVAFIETIKTASHVEVVPIDSLLEEQAWQLLKDRQDKEWSLVDCASFVVMQQHGITEALTTDRHFEQAGFVRLLKPEVTA